MTTELVPHPFTGEAVDLDAPTETLGRYRLELVDLRHRLDEFAATIDEELVHRMDQENARTLQAGPYTLKTTAPETTRWDVPALGLILEALANENRISRRAVTSALEQVVTYKPVATELRKLATHADPEVRNAIQACRTITPDRRRRVTVTPTHR
jgi:hypothetical protein